MVYVGIFIDGVVTLIVTVGRYVTVVSMQIVLAEAFICVFYDTVLDWAVPLVLYVLIFGNVALTLGDLWV